MKMLLLSTYGTSLLTNGAGMDDVDWFRKSPTTSRWMPRVSRQSSRDIVRV